MKINIKTIACAVIVGLALLATSVATNAQTKPSMKRRTTTRRAAAPLVPAATDLKVRINETLSSKDSRIGDRFTATVINPTRFDEARLNGHISSIQKSGKIKGRTSMNLAFDSVELRDGRKGVLHGYVTRIYGEGSRADNEGGVESSSRTNQTVKRAGIGATVGAIVGGIAGGGKGAAIGLIVGGAGGAGSLAVKGSKELKIESGTEMLVHVTR